MLCLKCKGHFIKILALRGKAEASTAFLHTAVDAGNNPGFECPSQKCGAQRGRSGNSNPRDARVLRLEGPL